MLRRTEIVIGLCSIFIGGSFDNLPVMTFGLGVAVMPLINAAEDRELFYRGWKLLNRLRERAKSEK